MPNTTTRKSGQNIRKQNADAAIDALSGLIDKAHSPYHCCLYCCGRLKDSGFQELKLTEPFNVKPGGRYYINIYDSTCIAFTVGKEVTPKKSLPRLHMLTAHTDWPAFLIKPRPEITSDKYGRLNTEPYGGAVYASWLDRPLGIAGKVCLKGKDSFHPVTRFVDSKDPVAVIPGLAIHMNHKVNDELKLNPQLHMLPLVFLKNDHLEKDNEAGKEFFLSYLGQLAEASPEEILDYEIFLYNADKGVSTGIRKELFSSPRIDNCSGVCAALEAVLSANTKGDQICISAFYHNEEIGSSTKQGADSALTMGILERILENLGFGMEMVYCILNSGLCLSLDVAHGAHPAYSDKNDLTNHVCLGDGVALKLSARQAYATDSFYVSIIESLCKEHGIPYAKYVNRSDIRGGSTLGSISSAKLGIPCVDAGVPLLSMHSARELMACEDQKALCELAKALFAE